MIESRPPFAARQAPGRKRLPILAVILVCVLIIGGALYKAVQVANEDPTFSGQSAGLSANGPALNPLRFTTTDASQLRPVSRERAEEINAAIPVSTSSNPAAASFSVSSANPTSFVHGLECLTDAIYYEAANEPLDGQRAVAQVILNRMRHPAYPHSICGVVYQGSERRTGCQFTFTCDGSLMRPRVPSLWMRARSVAMSAIGGFVYSPVGWSTHYHADYVTPYWAPTLSKVAVIGHHIFYRLSDSPRIASLFSARYTGVETAVPLTSLIGPELPIPGLIGGSDTPVTLAERPVLTREGAAMGLKPAEPGTPGATAAQPTRTLRTWVLSPSDSPETPATPAAQPSAAPKQN